MPNQNVEEHSSRAVNGEADTDKITHDEDMEEGS